MDGWLGIRGDQISEARFTVLVKTIDSYKIFIKKFDIIKCVVTVHIY